MAMVDTFVVWDVSSVEGRKTMCGGIIPCVGCFARMQKRKIQKMPDFKGQRDLFATKTERFASKT
jgi:hypothetical protein